MTETSNSSDANAADLLLVNAYIDRELDVANALDVKRKIDESPALASHVAKITALQTALREKLPPEQVSPALRRRIETSLGIVSCPRRPSWQALAASMLVAALVASGGTYFALQYNAKDPHLFEVADAHMRSLVAAKPFDVASSERHVVRPWFAGKLTFSPKVVDLSASGYPLAGARIDIVDANAVAALVFNRRQHIISLFVQPSVGASAPPLLRTLKGYNIASWRDGGSEYWAISDLNANELKAFAELFRTNS